METETLRPEFQNLPSQGETPRNEVLEPVVSQLKQEVTVNQDHLEMKPHTPSSNARQKPQATVNAPSPRSDDPTTEMDDVSESLQDPKPSSASTDPTPQQQNLSLKEKQLPCSPVRTPSQSKDPVETPPNLEHNVSSRSNTIHPHLPFSFPCEDGESSDEDDDFCRYYRSMFRRKSDSEMASPTPQSPTIGEQSKKGRNTRQSNGKVQKRKAKETLREIPFSDPKYHKFVGPVVLQPSDIARDLAAICGREYKESLAEYSKPPSRPNDRKRYRGSETPSGGSGLPHTKRLRQTNAPGADHADNSAAAEVGRSTRYGKRSSAQIASSSGDRGYQTGSKKQKTAFGNAAAAEMDQKKMFEKHPDKKGWVVCKKCEAAVWPPNCGKHLFHCRKQ